MAFIISVSNLFAQGEALAGLSPDNSKADSLKPNLQQKPANDTSDYIPIEKFYIADHQRVTLLGTRPKETTKIKPIPAAILGTLATITFIAQHEEQMNTIWKHQTHFRIIEDGKYALYSDKAGHFYGAFLGSYVWSEAFFAIGCSYELGTILGTAFGLGYSTYVEILDGFGKDWGFSPTDFYSDLLGAAFYLGQQFVPFLQNITPKFMYFPSNWHGDHQRVPSSIFIDDYSSQTFFLSFNIHNMLPKSMKDYWPKWLELSCGYAARNLSNVKCDYAQYQAPGVWGDPKFIVSLDYDLIDLLPEGGTVWNWLRQSLNYFKLPSPAVEFGHRTKCFLLYPFPIQIGNIRF